MKKVTKVLMYVYRKKKKGKEFFVLHRKKGDNVVLTGHVEPNEFLKQTVKREIKKELGVKPKKIVNLDMKIIVRIKKIMPYLPNMLFQ